MRKVIYSNESLMKDIASVKRYIDDDARLFSGDKVTFKDWLNTVNANLHSYGLNIDEHAITDPGSFVPFLDIQFCFSTSGILETDLYIKETDSTLEVHTRSIYSVVLCIPNVSDYAGLSMIMTD